jgi:LuxR family transcriptional regulator of csgAB operon
LPTVILPISHTDKNIGMVKTTMKQSPSAGPTPANRSLGSDVICIAGANLFNNEVLSSFLESETGMPCYCIQHDNLPLLYEQLSDETVLIFLDCATLGTPTTCEQACIAESRQNDHCMIVCFNVPADEQAESLALSQGIRGIVYDDQPVGLYARAAKAVLAGEFWYPREILEKHIMVDNPATIRLEDANGDLTGREQEILNMLSAGMRNRDIADRLCISPHTVKTHAYNLYRKINVRNRFEATQWLLGAQNLAVG